MTDKTKTPDKFTIINELAHRRGFFWQSYEIYGGVRGFVTYGFLGAKLKQRIEKLNSVEVSFMGGEKNLEEGLEELPAVTEVISQGDKYLLYTEDPSIVLHNVWQYASDNELKIISVNTLGPSLEDVFVKLTGIEKEEIEKKFENRTEI